MDESILIEQRKKRLLGFFKENSSWVVYLLLAVVVYISIYVRTRGLGGLRDITTGGWTLGPDLDPFLFLRWAKYIVENGSLFAHDALRYVPLGFNTNKELLMLPYSIAFFHKVATWFGSTSVEQSAAIFPVFVFALTAIAMFLLARKAFLKFAGEKVANYSAVVAAFFISVGVSLLPRTIAGIPEKENGGFLFLCLTLALFLYAWESKGKWTGIAFAALAGLSGALMANFWGAYIYLYVIVGLSVLVAFVFGHVDKQKAIVYSVWLILQTILTVAPTERYSAIDLLTNSVTASAFFTLAVILIDYVIFSTRLRDKARLIKLPKTWTSILVTVVLLAVGSSVLFGISFIPSKVAGLFHDLVQPIGDRLGVTVAENRQPYFSEWSNNFGPVIGGVPVYFWLFMIGSVYLANKMVAHFKKRERIAVTASYLIFLLAIVFSRYAQNSVLNGTNLASLSVYFAGVIVLVGTVGTIYYRRSKQNELEVFKSIDLGPVLLMVFFIISILSARGAVRLVMVLAPPTSAIVGYFFVNLIYGIKVKREDDVKKIAYFFVAGVVTLATIYAGYQMFAACVATSQGYIPSQYTQQWQKSMEWVRLNTPQDAVFAHWWDYGYWVQTMGERATMLDGGNALPYWNYLMGRYGLTGTSSFEAAELFYSHNVTHFLIDSTDIGKYTAFSSIGSDDNYDRRSWFGTFVKDRSKVSETKDSVANLFVGGQTLDEDIVYENNGTKTFLPGLGGVNSDISSSGLAAAGAVIIETEKATGKIMQPRAVYVYGSQQYILPLRYVFYNGSLIDFNSGVEAGVFVMPAVITSSQNQVQIDPDGSLLYLSSRVVNSQLARLYLYGEEDEYFKVANIQDDFVIVSLKSGGLDVGHFIYYGGFRGPIKIWEVKYPGNMQVKQEYLSTSFPKDKKFTI